MAGEDQTHVTPQTQLRPNMICGLAEQIFHSQLQREGPMQEGRKAEDTVRKQIPGAIRGDRLHTGHLQPWGPTLRKGVSLMSGFENQQG